MLKSGVQLWIDGNDIEISFPRIGGELTGLRQVVLHDHSLAAVLRKGVGRGRPTD
jgi:hypothetical protein